MCGITGFWFRGRQEQNYKLLLQRMTSSLRHRGPDDEGYLLLNTKTRAVQRGGGRDSLPALQLSPLAVLEDSVGADLFLGFRRLAILDLSQAGHQPMASADGSCWIVYNGEIYNYLELRQDLQAKGHTFHSATDTEVILAAYQTWGTSCLERFNGMWAFALWDGNEGRLFCARDRFGIKPFYYYQSQELFAFASEIKALLQLPTIVSRTNEGAIYDYLQYGRMDIEDETFFETVKRLPPAHLMWVEQDSSRGLTPISAKQYWSLPSPDDADDFATDQTRVEGFAELFYDSIRLRLRSDVTVGSCLSGGLDSSSIVCVANQLLRSENSVLAASMGDIQKTFSSCFEDERFDERRYIEQVIQQTKAEANYTFPTGEKLLDDLVKLIWHQDEPFAGLSIFAQWCVMEKAAARGVTVLLDGQGADELLGGYHPCFDYFWGGLLRRGQLRKYLRELRAYRRAYGLPLGYLGIRSLRPFAPVELQGLARRIESGSGLGISGDLKAQNRHRAYEFVERNVNPLNGYLSRLLHVSIPMLLRFEDRNSMAHSLEARVPFLDYRLVEYAFHLPDRLKLCCGQTKIALRKSMRGVLPEIIRTRKDKMGFVAPAAIWLREDIHEWVDETVNSASFKSRPYFNHVQIERALSDHASGSRDLSRLIWRWINLELWLRRFVDPAA